MNIILLIAAFVFFASIAVTAIVREAARQSTFACPSWRRSARVVAVRLIPALATVVVLSILVDRVWWICTLALWLTFDSLMTIWLFRSWLNVRGSQVLRAWLSQGILVVVAGVLFLFSVDRCIAAHTWINSSMSPNIRGYYVIEDLPDGTHLINAANHPLYPVPSGAPSGGIVAETFEYVERPRPAEYTRTADRFLCNKTKKPRRWDAIVFQPPNEPDFQSVKRLVGLPGERIQIRDGAVWINSEKLSPPERLGPIRYASQDEIIGDDWKPNELTLGADEYFVLGDNTHKSMDSREWGPLKKELMVGVVDVIYWPPSRWRVNP